MRKLGVLLAIMGIAALSPAPIKMENPADEKVLPEHSQEQLLEEQKLQKVHKEVGAVEHHAKSTETGESSPDAANTLEAAQSTVLGAEAVRKAGQNLERRSEGMPVIFWGILLAVLGFGSVYALRYWMAKHVPLPGDARKHGVTW